MDFRILGPLEAVADGRVVALDAAKPRALLAILLLHAGEPVSRDRLIEDLWDGRPPATAAKVLQTYVSQLRKALGSEVIVTRPAGYELVVEPDGFDLHRFERLVAEARRSEPAVAAARLREALALWRGPPLADFSYERWAQAEIGRLNELRLSALQDRIDADLALGRDGDLVGELERLVSEHPLSERLRGQLMLALYRSGRQAEALAAYRRRGETLVDDARDRAGRLRCGSSSARILDQDPALDVVTAERSRSPVLRGRDRACGIDRRRSSAASASCARFGRSFARGTCGSLTLTGAGRVGEDAARGRGDESASAMRSRTASCSSSSLRSATPSSSRAAIADALGRRRAPGAEAAREVLLAYLRDRRALLVLDNFEQLAAAAPLLTRAARGRTRLDAPRHEPRAARHPRGAGLPGAGA